jgi:hypothetical protein
MGLALSNDGKPVPSQAGSFCGLIPKDSEVPSMRLLTKSDPPPT